jgi:hypothetical protein
MALRKREQAASPEYQCSPAIGEHAVLHTLPAMEFEIDRLKAENATLKAENEVLRTLAYGDLAQDPKGTTDAPGGW